MFTKESVLLILTIISEEILLNTGNITINTNNINSNYNNHHHFEYYGILNGLIISVPDY